MWIRTGARCFRATTICRCRSAILLLLACQALSCRLISQAVSVGSPRGVAATQETESRTSASVGELICPGGFPTDLTMMNCSYTESERVQQWVTTALTDEAVLGAVVYGTGAEIIRSPSEWPRTWLGLGDRIGVRYTQAAARGTAEFIMGSILRDDPRHLSYKNDPLSHYGTKTSCKSGVVVTNNYGLPSHLGFARVGHAFLDSVTVRRSDPCGDGARLPAIDRLVGVWAGAYGGYPWYPRAENSFSNAGQRAAMAYGSTLLGSFYTEFSPEISVIVTKLLAHRKSSQ
jgi:hypothetical protein